MGIEVPVEQRGENHESSRIEYWQVHDLDRATAEEALPQIERQVHALVESLQ
jgi:hypothetical protein